MPATPPPPKGQRTVLRWIFLVMTWILVAAILVQSFLFGAGRFYDANVLTAHVEFGWMTGHMLAPLWLLVGLFTKGGRGLLALHVSAFVLLAIVPVLASMAADAPFVAALHPLSALVAFALLMVIEPRARALVRMNLPPARPRATPVEA